MLILGLSSFKHDTAAALFKDGVIQAAVENDKLVRSHTTGVPEDAILFCLNKAGATWPDLDAVAVGTSPFQGWKRRSLLRARRLPSSPVASTYHGVNEVGVFARELNQLRMLRLNSGRSQVVNFDHHLSHAASAFFFSPFERALIITMDQEGDGLSATVCLGEGTRIRVLHKIPFPHSLAWIYSHVTRLLGFTPHHDEHKTQWLSLEGQPDFKQVFLDMLWNPGSHLPRLNQTYVNMAGRLTFSGRFYREIGSPDQKAALSDDQRRALASSIQAACCEIVGSMAEHFRKQLGVDKVCLAGGLFQNTLLVSSLEKRLGINQVFVPPAPGNSGCALGAGMLAWHDNAAGRARVPAVTQVYGGPSCNRSEIKDVLDNCKARYSLQITEERKIEIALQLLEAGKIVGWFQGSAEFGPRALGNRSLLASPWAAYVRENLNDYIKHREWFRPFAVAVPEEDCERYFECSQLCRSMNTLAWARSDNNVLPEGFLLPGNLVRLQVVQQQSNPLFWRLLKRFGERAPAPLLVNTSFNLFGEPLVVKPRDAVRSYFCSGIDALVIDNFVLTKAAASQVVDLAPSWRKKTAGPEPEIAHANPPRTISNV